VSVPVQPKLVVPMTARSGLGTAQQGLLTLGVIGAFGVAASALYATTGLGLPCPLRLATGWTCPLCGGTRMGSALLHGDVAAALVYNPLALILLLACALLGVGWLVEVLGGPRLRVPGRFGRWSASVGSRTWWIAGVTIAMAYMLLRNLLWPIPA